MIYEKKDKSKESQFIEVVIVIPKKVLAWISNHLPRHIYFYRKMLYWYLSEYPEKFLVPVKDISFDGKELKVTLENGEEYVL